LSLSNAVIKISISLIPQILNLIFKIASSPTAIRELFEILSPIKINSVFGCCAYSLSAGILPVKMNYEMSERMPNMNFNEFIVIGEFYQITTSSIIQHFHLQTQIGR
jgi:hypothetical protein